MRIGIDLDDVIADSYGQLIDWHNTTFGTKLKLNQLTTSHLTQVFQTDKETILKRMEQYYASKSFKAMKPLKDAVKVIPLLSKSHQIFIITARPYYVKEATLKWLGQYFSRLSHKVFFSNPYLTNAPDQRSKSSICSDERIDFFIDDNGEYATECSQSCKQVVLIDKPWNREVLPFGFLRFKSLMKVYQYLQKSSTVCASSNFSQEKDPEKLGFQPGSG